MGIIRKTNKQTFLNWRGYLLGIGLVALFTWLKFLAQPDIIPARSSILYIVAIVPMAFFFGLGPALFVCILSLLVFDYYFLLPVNSLLPVSIEDVPIVLIFLLVGIAISLLTSNLRRKTEVATRELAAREQSESKYRGLFKTTSEAIVLYKYVLDEAGEVTDFIFDEINAATEKVTGMGKADLIGRSFTQIFGSEIIKRYLPYIRKMRRENRPVSYDGTENYVEPLDKYFLSLYVPLNSERFFASYIDITDRKKAEQTIQSMADHNKFLADILGKSSLPFGIGLPDGRLGLVNQAFNDLTGYNMEELKTMDWAKVLTPPEYGEMEAEKLAELVKNGLPVRYQKEYVRKDGSRVPVELLVHLVRNSKGQAEYYYSFVTDITERKKAEEVLKESEARFRSVLDNSRDVIYRVNLQTGCYEYISPSVEAMTGYSPAEWMALDYQTSLALIHPDDLPAARAGLARSVDTGQAELEYRQKTKNGDYRWISNRMSVAKDNTGLPLYRTGNLRDITESKHTEQELEDYARRVTQVQEEERRRIARELHDDTAQSIALLGLEIDSMVDSGKINSQEALERLKLLRGDTNRTMQDVRRYSHELMPSVLEHLGLEAALEQLVTETIEKSRLNIELEIEGVECSCNDEKKLALFRIVQEAINNIRKHAQATKVIIRVECLPDKINLAVIDNGQGFKLEQETAAALERGSMGLLSMRERAQLAGATLNIESAPGKGTTVLVEMPI